MEQLPLPEDQQAEPAFEQFSAKWEEAVSNAKTTGKPPKLMKVGHGHLSPPVLLFSWQLH